MWRCRRSLPVNAAHSCSMTAASSSVRRQGSSQSTVGKVVSRSSYSTPSTMTVPRSRSIRCRRLRSSRPNEGFSAMSAASTLNWMTAMAFWTFSVRRVSASESPGLPFRAKAVQGSFA